MSDSKISCAAKFGTSLFFILLAAILTLTTRLAARRGLVYLVTGMFIFMMLGGVGAEILHGVLPNDAKDIWLVGI